MKKNVFLFFVLMLSFFAAVAQTTRSVSGKVSDQNGDAVAGATVTVKGTKSAVAAGVDGAFTIRAKTGDVLVVTAINFQSNEVTVGTESVLNITLTRVASTLSEVVVTTAFGVQRQAKQLGYSTAKISNKDLTQAKVTDISTGLAGKVSGLQVNLTNNSVNPQTRIVLRGNRSITGNNQALLVVDGVPIDDVSYINKINPEDVDNVSVLKGAVAAAVYGSKASNGVLIITTKHGSKGKPSITVSNTTEMESVSYLPKFQHTFGGYGGEGPPYTNADGTANPVPYENQSYGPAYDGRTFPLAIYPIFESDGITVNHFDTVYTKYQDVPDGRKDFFDKGLTNQFNVSYSAGDERGTFFLGFQDATIKGIVPNDKSNRDNIRLGGAREYGKFRADYSFSYNQSKTDVAGLSYNQTAQGTGIGNGGVFTGRPLYFELFDLPSHIQITDFKDWRNNPIATPDGYFNAYATNPYWTIDNSRQLTNSYDFLGTVGLSLKLTPWLIISDRVGLTQRTLQNKFNRAGITFAPWAIADPWGAGNVPNGQKYLAPSTFDLTFFEQRINNDVTASFDKTFGDFSVKLFVGSNVQQRYQRTINLEGDNLQFANLYNISSVLGVPAYGEFSFKQREFSIFEEATIGYKQYLFLHVSNRDEWNSVLDPNQWHFNYPGADLSFVFTQGINALKNNKVLSYGKIRGGYSKVANINLGTAPYGAYSLFNTFGTAVGFPFGSTGGYVQNAVSLNALIKPEKTTAAEIGLELGFLQNRINLGATAYKSITKDQSLIAVVSNATGFTNKVVNVGQVTNTGLELDLNATVIKSREVTWTVGITYGKYHNKVDELLPGVDELLLGTFFNYNATPPSGGIYAVKGYSYPVIETTDWARDPATGKVIVDPVTGMPTVDPALKVFGSTNPTDILGINTSVNYKGFTLSAVVDYRGGNYIMNTIGQNLDFAGVSYHSAENGRQRFIFPNSVVLVDGKYVDNTSVAVVNGGNIGGAGFWPTLYNSGIGSPYITSAAFWKLRELSITYEVPAKVFSKVNWIKRASIGLIGRNLFMIRPTSNIWTDPEFSVNNGNAVGRTNEFQTPPTRIYGANISLTF